jgi:cytoskeleton protein RodZ
MTEARVADGNAAGALLREARDKQGLHIAALAAAIKVAPAKLEALESGRLHDLPDLTFARALAQSVCRVLKVDAKPVLDLLPTTARAAELERVDSGLKTPYREHPRRIDPTEWALWRLPAFWAVGALLVAAALVWLWPGRLGLPGLPGLPQAGGQAASAAVEALARAASAVTPVASAVIETVHSTPDAGAQPAATASGAAAELPTNMVLLRSTEASWVEVTDARGQSLFSRTMQPGEAVGLDGELPLKLKVGNASGTQLSFRGKPLDLAAFTRDNVARIELK